MSSPCYCIDLRRATHAVTRFYDEALAESGLRVTQFSLLKRIRRLGVASIGALAAETALDRTTLTRNLQPLLEAGLVEETEGSDRRQRPLRLTAAGESSLARAMPLWQEAQKRIDSLLGRERAKALRELLAALEGAAAVAAPQAAAQPDGRRPVPQRRT